MKQARIDFIEESHTYLVDGEEIPSVTTILKDVGIIPYYYTKASAARGKRKHKIIEAYLKNNLDWSVLSEEEMGLIEVLQVFLDKYVNKIIGIEVLVYNKTNKYSGAIDLIYKNKQNLIDIVDFKSGQKENWHDLQLTAYFHTGNYNQSFKLYISSKKYELTVVDNIPEQFITFLAARKIYKWKHGK